MDIVTIEDHIEEIHLEQIHKEDQVPKEDQVHKVHREDQVHRVDQNLQWTGGNPALVEEDLENITNKMERILNLKKRKMEKDFNHKKIKWKK